MKFFHVADIHLGAAPDSGFPWGEKRKEEVWDSFCRLLERAEQEAVDLILIAGDLFHRQPLLRELKEVNYLFSKLTRTRVVLIAGNHDYLKKDSYYRSMEWNDNVTFLASGQYEKVVFSDIKTSVYGLSYHSREIREPLYDDLQPDDIPGMRNILLAHGGDEKHIPINWRKLQRSGFDYVALGHIHKPQPIIENKIVYAGALEPIDKNDLGMHGFISGIYENNKLNITFVPWSVRQYIKLKIDVDERATDHFIKEEIQSEISRLGEQNIYKIALSGYRDPDIIFQTGYYQDYGNVIEVIDGTHPAYDFDKLFSQHPDDIIGQYIERLYRPGMTKIEEKALHYGIQALQGAKE